MRALLLAILGSVAIASPSVCEAEPVRLHAAGSLRAALTDIARTFEAGGGGPVEATFGASGLLRDAIAGDANAEVFASANMEHPRSLSQSGRNGPVVMFSRNRLCALARPGLGATTATLIERMLDPGVKLGTLTPRADPSGDYAWEAFRRVDAQRPGSLAVLDGKALQLTGGPASPKPPADRSIYGVTVMDGASERAYRLALFILSPDGQASLARHGFSAPKTPSPAAAP